MTAAAGDFVPLKMPKPKTKDGILYFTDNGAVYCGEHCGASAGVTFKQWTR